MPISVQFSNGQFPLGFCISSPQQFFDAMIALMTGVIPGNFSGVIISANQPQNTDQDKLWVKTDATGRPVGIFLYKGSWLWPNPRPPASPERMIWTSSEAALWAYDGGDGTNPTSFPPTATTGAMWQRDTNFGADDGSIPFRVPVGIGKNSATYDGNAATVLIPGSTGGAERLILDQTMLPVFSPNLAANTGTDQVWTAVNGTGTVKNGPGIGSAGLQNQPEIQTSPSTYGNANPPAGQGAVSTQNMPPYYGVIFAQRTARTFYTQS